MAPAAALALATPVAGPVAAQQEAPQGGAVDAATRKAVISGVLRRLDALYVFPAAAHAMETDIRAREARGEYDSLGDARVFAESLTTDLRTISRDRHLSVFYSARPIPVAHPDAEPTPEMRRELEEQLHRTHFAFEKVEVLPGNIGYIDLRGFAPVDVPGAEETVAAAMDSVADTDALIFDLRRNGGGEPEMVQLIASYLFAAKPVHLNSLYWRPGNRTEEFWTLDELRGHRYGPSRPVYVLTSKRTFSAAEEFSYDLQTRQRATIVGETTGGGAHAGAMERVTEHFGVWVPSARAINPVTHTDWEGTGVKPDLRTSAEQALAVARLDALRTIRAGTRDETKRAALDALIREMEANAAH